MDLKPQLTAALVIEHQSLAQSHIKYSLQNIGFPRVDTVDRSHLAIKALHANYYDLVLCASDLNKGSDGFQLYEKMLNEQLIPNTTTFIFMSADQDLQLSQSVIELKPDEFLLKPFNSKEFESRVNKALIKKLTFKDVLKDIDKQNYNSAIEKLNTHISNNKSPQVTPYLMKLKGEIITLLKNWSVGETFFKKVCNIHPYTWAQIGYIESLYYLGKHNLARPHLLEMTKSPQTRLFALDLLARIEQQHQEFEQALGHLKQAASIAPRNVNRLQELANVARVTHDFESQHDANNSIIRHLKNSIHETPDAYLAAVRSAIDYGLTTMNEEEISRLAQSSQSILANLKKSFPQVPLSEQIEVAQARIYNLKNNPKKAKQLISHSVERIENELIKVNGDNLEDTLDVAKALHELGFHKHSQQMFEKLADYCNNQECDQVFSKFINAEKQLRIEIKESPKELNNKAVDFFKRGNLKDALNSFEVAFKVMPKNPTIALNLMQTALESTRHLDQSQVNYIIERCQRTIEQAHLTAEQTARFDKLKEIMQKQFV